MNADTVRQGASVRIKLPPLLYVVLLAAALTVQFWVLPWDMPASGAITVSGVILTVAGLALSLSAAATVLRHRTTLAPHHPVARLVTTGPFRISRNPMYTGLTIAYLGVALWIGTWWPIVLAPLAVLAMLRGVILPEEAYLAERFGDEYARYRRAVRRWL